MTKTIRWIDSIQNSLSEETVRELEEWLRLNKINMTATEWLNSCIKRLGLCEDKITNERFGRQSKKRRKR